MRLEFCLLIVDDHPETVGEAIRILSDYLESKGFLLRTKVAEDLSEAGLRDLARSSGKDYNLVMVDYNLGRTDSDGAVASARMRKELQFTDMVFYSSSPSVDLLKELAGQGVAGVFVAYRGDLSDALVGLAETVIGKAVDLSHMRGIAMAEVADMDVQMEHVLEKVFTLTGDEKMSQKAKETLQKLFDGANRNVSDLKPLVDKGLIVDVVTDPRIFPSMQKYMAIMRVAKCLSEQPQAALETLKSYEVDVIHNRNTLAHAKEDVQADGTLTLRSIKRGKPSVTIDDAWMTEFRGKLRAQRLALTVVCDALGAHADGFAAKKNL